MCSILQWQTCSIQTKDHWDLLRCSRCCHLVLLVLFSFMILKFEKGATYPNHFRDLRTWNRYFHSYTMPVFRSLEHREIQSMQQRGSSRKVRRYEDHLRAKKLVTCKCWHVQDLHLQLTNIHSHWCLFHISYASTIPYLSTLIKTHP